VVGVPPRGVGDESGFDLEYAVIAGVADEDRAVGRDGDAVGAVEPRGTGRAAVAAIAAVAVADEGLDGASLRVDASDGVVLGVDDQEVAGAVDGQLLGAIEFSGRRGAAVSGVAASAGAGPGGDEAGGRVDGPEGVPLALEDEDGPVGTDLDG